MIRCAVWSNLIMTIKLLKPLALLVFIATLSTLSVGRGAVATSGSNSPRVGWPHSGATQLVFFAVLEGLYGDGVSNDDVDLIIPPGKDGEPTFDKEHFVYACPLCHPAFEAFRLYRRRQSFFGLKARIDTFGPGLETTTENQLRSSDADTRRKAIQGLIQRWVGQRLDMMRLSDAERKAITSQIEQGRKIGMGDLKQWSNSRTNCPICDGSFGACKFRPALRVALPGGPLPSEGQ